MPRRSSFCEYPNPFCNKTSTEICNTCGGHLCRDHYQLDHCKIVQTWKQSSPALNSIVERLNRDPEDENYFEGVIDP